MRKRTKIAISAVVGVLILGSVTAIAGPRIYRDFFSAPPANLPTLTADDEALTAQAYGPIDIDSVSGDWVVADGSEAGYRVNEVLNGVEVTVTGRTDQIDGAVTVDGTTLISAKFSVDVASISTDSSSRDSYFRGTAMRVSEFPVATFLMNEPVISDVLPDSGSTFEREITGELTLAGVTQTVTFVVEARTDGTTAEIAAQIPILFSDFGVTAPNLGFVSVEDHGFLELQLTLEHSQASQPGN